MTSVYVYVLCDKERYKVQILLLFKVATKH